MKLLPRMLFLMPSLAIITGTAGFYLAKTMGFFELPYPDILWVYAAVVIITILTVQGLCVLLPINLLTCLELQKEQPISTNSAAACASMCARPRCRRRCRSP